MYQSPLRTPVGRGEGRGEGASVSRPPTLTHAEALARGAVLAVAVAVAGDGCVGVAEERRGGLAEGHAHRLLHRERPAEALT